MINIIDYLKKNILLFDGAVGTMLMNKGWDMNTSSEMLNLTHPSLIKEIHKEYINAGSKVITTNTFMCNIFNEEKYGYNMEEVIETSINIAKDARSHKEVYIALSVGPSGAFFKNEEINETEIYNNFKRIAKAGEKASVDVILLETFIHINELKIALKAVKNNSSLPVFCTMSTIGENNSLKDTSSKELCQLAESYNCNGVGINCSNSPEHLESIVKDFLHYSNLPVMVKPNTGYIKNATDITKRKNIDDFVYNMQKFTQLGVKIIGGCCGTTPEYIEKLSEIVI